MAETSARLLRLLSLLQSRRGWTGPELSARLEVSTRTVRNDIDRLRRLGYPVGSTPGVASGYRIGAAKPPLLLDDEEAVAVTLGLRSAATGPVAGVEEASARTLAKTTQLLPATVRHRDAALQAFVEPAPAGAPSVEVATLTTLAAACRDRQRLRFAYRSRDGSDTRREVEPYRLVNVGRRWYLLAFDLGRDAWRTFRADRIAVPAGRRFSPRALPDDVVAAYAARTVGSAPRACRATSTAHSPAGPLIGLPAAAVTVEPLGEDRCRVHPSADDPESLAHQLGRLGVDSDLDDPDSHRELIEQLRPLARRYDRAALTGARP
ncbi:MAG: WYL domain-containing protein [Microbacteriaceae bacterium]